MTEQEILDFLKVNNLLVFYAIRGSHLYGTNVETSDVDHHGIFTHSPREWLRIYNPKDDYSDNKRDVVVFELKKYISLLMSANPTVLEMMWTPPEFVLFENDISKKLFSNRELFVTKKCFYSFSAYAHQQCKKASGKNKKVMNEPKYNHEPGIEKLRKLLLEDKISAEWVEVRFSKHFITYLLKEQQIPLTQNTSYKDMDVYLDDEDIKALLPPKRDQYCYIIPANLVSPSAMPSRPIPLLDTNFNLEHFNCSSVEHVGHVYRLYNYGEKANGVFHGGEVVCSSIPIEHETSLYSGLLIYSVTEYESAKSEWRSFWEWMANRNEGRWHSEDSNENFQYDRKNMQHTIRLLFSAEHIVKNGFPLIRFSGSKLDYLRNVRAGRYEYKELMDLANDKVAYLEQAFKDSSLPDACNTKAVSELYDELIDMQLRKNPLFI